MERKKVKDIMIPVEEYATIKKDASLLDMVYILDESNKKLPEGHHKLRSVLVTDLYGDIIGKIGHLVFLKALEPKYDRMTDFNKLSNAGLSSDFLQSIMSNLSLWDDIFIDISQRAKMIKVSEVMHPINESVNENTSVFEAIHKMIMWDALSIPVTKESKVTGLIRQADLYREITAFIKETCNH